MAKHCAGVTSQPPRPQVGRRHGSTARGSKAVGGVAPTYGAAIAFPESRIPNPESRIPNPYFTLIASAGNPPLASLALAEASSVACQIGRASGRERGWQDVLI